MTWKTSLRDELVSRIQPTGLTAYMVYHPRPDNITKRDWQDELITALISRRINVQKSNWDTDTYDDRGILLCLNYNRLFKNPKFISILENSDSLQYVIFAIGVPAESFMEPHGFTQTDEIKILGDPSFTPKIRVFERIRR